ncbi:MAG: hypothetical protein N3B21_02405 [Clostridia bacterium]|nr:hypothetical protein [Clostridia bacterium]
MQFVCKDDKKKFKGHTNSVGQYERGKETLGKVPEQKRDGSKTKNYATALSGLYKNVFFD